jgi:hypothetical protein
MKITRVVYIMRRATRRINYYSLAFMLALMLALGLGLAFYSSHMKEGFDEPSQIVEDALQTFRTGVQNFQDAKYISDNLVITDNKELTIKKEIIDPAVNKISIEIESANSKMNALFAPPPPPPPPPAELPLTKQARDNKEPVPLPPPGVRAISI